MVFLATGLGLQVACLCHHQVQGQVGGSPEGRDGAVVLFGSHELLPIKIMQQHGLSADAFGYTVLALLFSHDEIGTKKAACMNRLLVFA